MRGKLVFLGGMAAGFVLGTRAGREKYEELVRATQKIKENPAVQDATDVVRDRATRLYSEGRHKMTDRLAGSRFAETRFGRRFAAPTEADAEIASIERTRGLDDTLTTPGVSTPTGVSTRHNTVP